jgi:tetratricopeptide (TPR) repeat protein
LPASATSGPATAPAGGAPVIAANAPADTPLTPEDELKLLKALPEGELARTVELMQRIASGFPGTATAKRATGHIEALSSDPRIGPHLARLHNEEAAKALLSTAEMYYNGGMLDKAQDICQKVLDKYPDTAAAAKANQRLGAIKGAKTAKPKPATAPAP